MKLPSLHLPRNRNSLLKLAIIPAVACLIGMVAFQFVPRTVHAENPTLSKEQDEILSGFASYELNPANGKGNPHNSPKNYFTTSDDGCPTNLGSNVKVNQNCENLSDPVLAGRGQAQNETSIAIDPNNSNRMVAGYNDYRLGDGTCGISFSKDGGADWTDSSIPKSFTYGTTWGVQREYWQAGGDPSVAWDTKGNAYFDCQVFLRGNDGTPPLTNNPDSSSGVYVFRSTQNGGASWNFPGRPVIEANATSPTNQVILEDKPYMTIDDHVGSPYQDRIYVTWTEFLADGSAYLWESHSSDYGETFSKPVVVSKNSTALCPVTYGAGTENGNCNENQFSDPFTGADGALYVVYNNYNNAVSGNDNRNQFLLVKSTDGGATFSAPIKVSDYYDLPDCETYQGSDNGRACVPEKGSSARSVFRATDYASGAVNPTNPQNIVVTFGSYINQDSNESNGCIPNGSSPTTGFNLYTGVKTPGACNNKILISVSNDGGATFSGTNVDPRNAPIVNTDPGQKTTDQFWQWEAFTNNGKLAISYYDRAYGSDETTGAMDISLSSSKDLVKFAVQRVTSRSMPAPTEFPDANGNGLFFGDYSGLAAANDAHPLWMDTRDPELFACGSPPAVCTGAYPDGHLANDQDIFTAELSVPSK